MLKLSSMAKQKKISVIIPVYNAPGELKACVESLKRTACGLYELIIVDNASGPETRRYISGLRGAIRIRNSSNRGFAAAVNQGIKASSGRYLTLVNSDIVFFDGGLQGLAACLDYDPGVGAAGPFTNRTVGQQLMHAPGAEGEDPKAIEMLSQAVRLRFDGEGQEVHRLMGFCLMFRREAYESVGLLDERFKVGCYEDIDYSMRLRQAGWKLKIAREVLVWHRDHSSFKHDAHFLECVRRNKKVFIDKWCRKALEFLDELDQSLETPAPPAGRARRDVCGR